MGREAWKFYGKFLLACWWRTSNIEEWLRSFSPDYRPISYNPCLERPVVKGPPCDSHTEQRELNEQARISQQYTWFVESGCQSHGFSFIVQGCCRRLSQEMCLLHSFKSSSELIRQKFKKVVFNCKIHIYIYYKWWRNHPGPHTHRGKTSLNVVVYCLLVFCCSCVY